MTEQEISKAIEMERMLEVDEEVNFAEKPGVVEEMEK
jgi:hypothetical protein